MEMARDTNEPNSVSIRNIPIKSLIGILSIRVNEIKAMLAEIMTPKYLISSPYQQ